MKHASDRELCSYLNASSDELLFDLAQIVGDRLGFNGIKGRFESPSGIPKGEERGELVETLLRELGYFGSNNLAYVTRAVVGEAKGVGYHEILFEVVQFLNKQLKTKLNVPRIASVEEREYMVSDQISRLVFQGKSEENIAQMLREAGLESDAVKAAAIKAAVQGGAGAAVIGLVKLLGKKTVAHFLAAAAIKIIAMKVGKEAAEKIVARILQKIPQKTIAAVSVYAGVAMIAKDVLDLAGPALRVTVPAVALIASTRTAERLQAE